MDTNSFLIECALFTVNFGVSYCFYKLYKKNAGCLKSLKEAEYFEIDSKLKEKVEKNGGGVKYAVISGSTKALSFSLKNKCIYSIQGVIEENIIKQHTVKWNPIFGSSSSSKDIQHVITHIPFALCSKTTGLFERKTRVEVVEPLTAKELVLPIVYDNFKLHHGTVNDAIIALIQGQRTEGFQQTQKKLLEGTTLTAVGKLIIENDQLKIKQPDNGYEYFLTHLSIESLINKFHAYTGRSKIAFIVTGTLTFALFIYISKHAFSIIKRKIVRNRRNNQLEE